LVDKAEVPATVGEADAYSQVRFGWTGSWHHKKLAAHTQMRHQAGLVVVERQPQKLAPPADTRERSAGESIAETACTSLIAAYGALVQDFNP
jgi:hypothetical protein